MALKLGVCGSCHNWVPLRSNPKIGVCRLSGAVKAFEEGSQQCYMLLRPSKFEFMWCSDCDTIISRDEVEEHIFHELHPTPYIENEIHKETYTAA